MTSIFASLNIGALQKASYSEILNTTAISSYQTTNVPPNPATPLQITKENPLTILDPQKNPP
jgi:hypothetical protein